MIRYHFYSSGTDAVYERLDRGLLSFAIIIQEVDLSKYNYVKVPSFDRWGILMRRDSHLAEKASIHVKDLMGLSLISSRQSLQEEMPRWFGENLVKIHIIATYDLLFITSIMVRENFGYAIGFEGLVDTGSDSGLCFCPLGPTLESPIYIIWKKYQMFTQVLHCYCKS